MNKFALVLIFSVFAFIKGANPNYFNTEPYHSFDWLDKDEQEFKVVYDSGDDTKDYFCYLYNQSHVCKPSCSGSSNTITCKLKGEHCQADGDNPAYKYYYTLRCEEKFDKTLKGATKATTYSENSSADDIKKLIDDDNGGIFGDDVGVTIAVCSGNFLKYSMFLLSLLIL